MAEKFCLKWNDFTTNTTRTFGLLRKEDFLQDVTLVGEDNHQVAAHKLILSSCSEYFKNIFKNNKHSHPLLCLEGITSQDLDNILNYIYEGELKLYQDDLDRFLRVAERFKLEGLLGDNQREASEEPNETKNCQFETKPSAPKKENSVRQRREDVSKSNHIVERQLSTYNDNVKLSLTEEEIQNLDEKVNQHFEKREDGLHYCKLCGKSARQRCDIKNHIEAKHLEGIQIPCPICGKIFRSRNYLLQHKSMIHKQK